MVVLVQEGEDREQEACASEGRRAGWGKENRKIPATRVALCIMLACFTPSCFKGGCSGRS